MEDVSPRKKPTE